ncbi:DUF6298 domain-containing protein [Dyadobacter fanqingshengii]|uniref:DUF6298 domain-containing protein n=1 Tax=Dyadobacter fanqingshengii TaxID=2906443 RepID=A0A9X1PBB9_9BACT|nr:DUF6298 domain-containing protein [Dyadobacter fanqingshengii]MCF0040523.1 DUF6298 domain-containing protein [Dyadobacter fanqingshengii]USJ37736.1 DUF6298 domain-containing protein [Dyadobacter fanqingshengii]
MKLPSPVAMGEDGKLHYAPDSLGNRIVDFSYAGYMAGNKQIPDVPIKVVVPAKVGDATLRIQSAIDYVGSLPPEKDGFRGAVLLEKGEHTILGGLFIRKSGIIIRGNGTVDNKTTLVGAGLSRETILTVLGSNDPEIGNLGEVNDEYVPVNALTFNVVNAADFKTGDRIQIRRPSTKAWIRLLKMEEFGGETGWLGWKPGQRDIVWDRTITAISRNQITINAPLTTALDKKYGGGFITKYDWPGRISQVGIENLCIESTFDSTNLKDEEHRWMGVRMENVENAWVRQVHFKGLAGSAVALFETASQVTVEDCKSLMPVSEIAGQRRNTFYTQGQLTLFQRCYAENGFHDFTTGYRAAGPNAFVQCESVQPFGFSGTADSWASGVLFDNVVVDGQALSFKNRGQDGQGAGWTAANSVMWQCSASRVENVSPPGVTNFAFGIWAEFAGDGFWENVNEHIKPRSLYFTQLSERIGNEALSNAALMPKESEASSSPSIQQAAELTAKSNVSAASLADWIDSAKDRNPIPVIAGNVKTIDEIGIKTPIKKQNLPPLTIQNGWLVRGEQVVTGNRQEVPWWRGSIRPHDVAQAKPHITRFVPGRSGAGLTDIPEAMTDSLLAKNITVLDHNYGLWYDRRRDDHERIRRIDSEVWPPFYEQPFARSGKETAWDKLSKYDLSKYNAWYWTRLKEFVQLADQKGLVLYHQNYFQHNILEAGAHYADFPWRSANNINATGFPEPPPYAGDKRIFMAEQFYDIENPQRRAIHTAYIRKCLENFADQSGVIQFIGAEYTGPLHFVKFWLDVIADWEKETGKNALVALSTTKDVQDAILAEPGYAKIVDIIDIRYWHLREDGTFYAPEGGKNLAPRQHARLQKTGKISFHSIYKAVLDYRWKYPEKAVLYSAGNYDSNAWAVFLAGGSISAIPRISDGFLNDVSKMKPDSSDGYRLFNTEYGAIIYKETATSFNLDLSGFKGNFLLRRIDPTTGKWIGKTDNIKGGKSIKIGQTAQATAGPVVFWITKK